MCCLDRYWSFCLTSCQVPNHSCLMLLFCPQRCLIQVTFSPFISESAIKAEAIRVLSQKKEQEVFKKVHDEDNCQNALFNGLYLYQSFFLLFCFPFTSFQDKNAIQEMTKKGKTSTLNQGSSKLKEKTSKVSLTPKSESPLQALNPEDIQKELVYIFLCSSHTLCDHCDFDYYTHRCFLNILF